MYEQHVQITQLQNYPITKLFSPLRQRNALAVVAEHIQYLDRVWRDSDHLVTAVHNVAFFSDENVLVLGQKDSFGSPLWCGETVKLQVDRRRRSGRGRRSLRRVSLRGDRRRDGLRNLYEHLENISSRPLILRIFTRF